ncbi:type II CRISPR-associated endonuclease Cas1 [Vagococcus penaei]|uniref:CRISPR-associated endonuclease Cas1 n=1 Tax=Vagococcus penaei TaxID=633807 RepID=A0A1Q2D7A2_9ENTE|nr:type II CRISPR-associated endonuclease Cas1 [Vagococcus penaei]AQP54279.1 subtype II CRISPR-associated endonuclease Cas1 [Vagococcus penaei]RSU05836.1 type II CRISPR-associated endonuclease Cas1 [Vagococcus penaei]
MTWRVVHVKDSQSMKLKLDNLEIMKGGHCYLLPLADISMLVLEGNMTVTTNILSALSKYNIVTVICDQKYLPTGLLLNYGGYHRSAKRALSQTLWTRELKAVIWKEIVGQKMLNQIVFAQTKDVTQERLDLMTDLYSELQIGDITNREGHVAKVYFKSLYGSEFTRETDCFENAAMNYGYAILRAAMARLVVGQGLLTMLGVFHCNEYNAYNLVDDLMEPFRPVMDYWIDYKLLSQCEFLTYDARLTLIDFLNQPMFYKTTKSTVDQVMQKYVSSFVKAMTEENPALLHQINLQDFVEARK